MKCDLFRSLSIDPVALCAKNFIIKCSRGKYLFFVFHVFHSSSCVYEKCTGSSAKNPEWQSIRGPSEMKKKLKKNRTFFQKKKSLQNIPLFWISYFLRLMHRKRHLMQPSLFFWRGKTLIYKMKTRGHLLGPFPLQVGLMGSFILAATTEGNKRLECNSVRMGFLWKMQ